MSRIWLLFRALAAGLLVALPALAQDGIRWQQDIEGARILARQSGRLVLVHFWTPECAPCKALEQNVFSQPGVAGAVETCFVPVKLNANENSATAEGFGITRVPTDIILTPDGQVIGKLISPPTPAGYVAELTKVASQYSTRAGGAFESAIATAPNPSQLNSAYAGLSIPASTSPVIPIAQKGPGGDLFANSVPLATPNRTAVPTITAAGPAPATASLGPVGIAPAAVPQATNPPVPPSPPVAGPNFYATVNNDPTNRYAALSLPAQAPAVAPMPQSTANRYSEPPPASASPTAPPFAAPPIMNQLPSLNQAPSSQLSKPYVPVTPPALPPVPSVTPTLPHANANPTNAPINAQAPQQPNLADPNSVKSSAPDPSRLPPGAPPLGFDGYCPVNMRNHWKWVAGNPQYGAIHRGRTYWFASPADQAAFLKNPDNYTPALSGYDPVLVIDHKQQVPGRREHSLDYDNLFYLFASEATLQQFTANPEKYATGVRQAMGLNRGRLVR